MALDTTQTIPQWVWNFVLAAFSGLLSVIVTLVGFIANGYRKRFVVIEEAQKRSASVDQITALELRVAQMASRKELAAYIERITAEGKERDTRTREDRISMHNSNEARLIEIRDDMKEMRSDIRAVHQRIDEVLAK